MIIFNNERSIYITHHNSLITIKFCIIKAKASTVEHLLKVITVQCVIEILIELNINLSFSLVTIHVEHGQHGQS